MHEKQVICIMGPSPTGCDQLRGMLEQQDLEVHAHVKKGGHLDVSVLTATVPPRLVLLDLGDQGVPLLKEWSALPETLHIPLIVIGPSHDSQLMRSAMQAGARDYFTHPVPAEELLASVRQILRESKGTVALPGGKLTSVMDAKGGSGASFIAVNLAHMLVAHLGRKTALIDMDLQFGALPLSLDLHPRTTLFDAIGNAEQLDPVALKAYMTEHASGLHVLGTMSEQLVMPWEVSIESVQKVLQVAVQAYAHVVTDLPRQIDPFTGAVLSASDRILVVMQRSFAHLRDAQRMFNLMRGYLGVPSERITLIVNRHDGNAPISDDDIQDAIRPSEILRIPNDFEHVTESLNVGVPLYQGARNAAITKVLCGIAEKLDVNTAGVAGVEPRRARSGLARVFGLRK